MTIGVWVDEHDHVWIIHRSSATLNNNERGAELKPPTGECCRGAPPVLVFDQAGNLVRHWGGPGQGYEWPQSNHGIFVDYKGNVWIGGNGEKDAQVLKFTKDGKFVDAGRRDARPATRAATTSRTSAAWRRSSSTRGRTRRTSPTATCNRRVAVLDADTGKMKRYWGAYGNRPEDDAARRLQPGRAAVAAVPQPGALRGRLERRPGVRLRPPGRPAPGVHEGRQVREGAVVSRGGRLSEGSVWDIAFSKDSQQRYIFMADGRNQKVRIIGARRSRS